MTRDTATAYSVCLERGPLQDPNENNFLRDISIFPRVTFALFCLLESLKNADFLESGLLHTVFDVVQRICNCFLWREMYLLLHTVSTKPTES